MTYAETLDFLYNRLAAFHRIGNAAYKPGLDTSLALSHALGDPHAGLRCIHVGGTNGKGSTAHTVAAILSAAGYKTGLYTSPHLLDFAERIRIDGAPVPHSYVVDFVERFHNMHCNCDPSFFELATVMAFDYFATENVDFAVIEVGLGGRLDSTNIITPLVAAVTNISMDHTAILGGTLAEIAAEKAGIFKHGVPAIVGESMPETMPVFTRRAAEVGTEVVFADKAGEIVDYKLRPDSIEYETRTFGSLSGELCGDCQVKNTATVLEIVKALRAQGVVIPDEAVRKGFSKVCELTGLAGRWMTVSGSPLTICDTGHNPGAWQYLGPRLAAIPGHKHIVLGFVGDKDIDHILDYLPADAHYYFVQPSTPRAAKACDVAAKARERGLLGLSYNTVAEGYNAAHAAVTQYGGMIYVGGSTFVVADFLALR